MENIKKYFQFSGTISGLNYLLRNLLSYLVSYTGGYMVGTGIMQNDTGLTTIGFIIVVPAIIFGFATLYKRVLALSDVDAISYTIGIILVQILSQFTGAGLFKSIFGLLMIAFSCILIFQNSKIEDHKG